MAEEELAPAEGEPEGTIAPSEEEETAEQAQARSIEDFARERGWKPKEEYSGDEGDWRDAESFLAFGMDRNRDLFREVKTLRDGMDRMSKTQGDIIEQNVDRVRKEERQRWEAKHRQAVEEGDYSTATEAVQKIAELAQPAPRRNNAAATTEAFAADNPWFNSDPLARSVAVAAAQQLANRGVSDVAEQFKAAKEAVHKRFPEYGPAPSKTPPAVQQPTSRAVDTRNRKKSFNDMPTEAQQACRELVKRGFTSQEGYVKQYFQNEERSNG